MHQLKNNSNLVLILNSMNSEKKRKFYKALYKYLLKTSKESLQKNQEICQQFIDYFNPIKNIINENFRLDGACSVRALSYKVKMPILNKYEKKLNKLNKHEGILANQKIISIIVIGEIHEREYPPEIQEEIDNYEIYLNKTCKKRDNLVHFLKTNLNFAQKYFSVGIYSEYDSHRGIEEEEGDFLTLGQFYKEFASNPVDFRRLINYGIEGDIMNQAKVYLTGMPMFSKEKLLERAEIFVEIFKKIFYSIDLSKLGNRLVRDELKPKNGRAIEDKDIPKMVDTVFKYMIQSLNKFQENLGEKVWDYIMNDVKKIIRLIRDCIYMVKSLTSEIVLRHTFGTYYYDDIDVSVQKIYKSKIYNDIKSKGEEKIELYYYPPEEYNHIRYIKNYMTHYTQDLIKKYIEIKTDLNYHDAIDILNNLDAIVTLNLSYLMDLRFLAHAADRQDAINIYYCGGAHADWITKFMQHIGFTLDYDSLKGKTYADTLSNAQNIVDFNKLFLPQSNKINFFTN